jgi:hypothetical protein
MGSRAAGEVPALCIYTYIYIYIYIYINTHTHTQSSIRMFCFSVHNLRTTKQWLAPETRCGQNDS